MSSKKYIDIFGTSFLDLLTCALAAMIILFVVVPKAEMNSSTKEETVEESPSAPSAEEPVPASPETPVSRWDKMGILGSFSGFGLLVQWPERDADVNIGVQRYGSSPEQCGDDRPVTDWGVFIKETRPESGTDRCALFFMPDIYPDDYTMWVELDSRSAAKSAEVTATMVFHPGLPDEDRFVTGPLSLTGSGRIYVATIAIAGFGLIKLSNREPIAETE